MEKKVSEEMLSELISAVLSLRTADDCKEFFTDLCTGAEIEQFAQRLRAAKLLLEGQTYAQIIAQTELSSATLSRVSNCVQRGTGGYEEILKRIGG